MFHFSVSVVQAFVHTVSYLFNGVPLSNMREKKTSSRKLTSRRKKRWVANVGRQTDKRKHSQIVMANGVE